MIIVVEDTCKIIITFRNEIKSIVHINNEIVMIPKCSKLITPKPTFIAPASAYTCSVRENHVFTQFRPYRREKTEISGGDLGFTPLPSDGSGSNTHIPFRYIFQGWSGLCYLVPIQEGLKRRYSNITECLTEFFPLGGVWKQSSAPETAGGLFISSPRVGGNRVNTFFFNNIFLVRI